MSETVTIIANPWRERKRREQRDDSNHMSKRIGCTFVVLYIDQGLNASLSSSDLLVVGRPRRQLEVRVHGCWCWFSNLQGKTEKKKRNMNPKRRYSRKQRWRQYSCQCPYIHHDDRNCQSHVYLMVLKRSRAKFNAWVPPHHDIPWQ